MTFQSPADGANTEVSSCMITTSELSLAAAREALDSPRFGGHVFFAGTVREWTKGRQTAYLEYESYIDMAIPLMQAIEADVKDLYPSVETLQWHRIGHLNPTDIAVICAAASPHRDDAFDAARMLIERLKKEVPIWKKEVYQNGEIEWQANDPRPHD